MSSLHAQPGAIVKHAAPANDTAPKTQPEVGDEMPDGTIYAGISPYTCNPMYARPVDEPGTYTFGQAREHAENIGNGFRVPTLEEGLVLYNNRNKGKLKGTFDEASVYWSSKFSYSGHARCFGSGFSDRYKEKKKLALRLVR